MTVWTDVSLDEANQWLDRRGFGAAHSISPVEEGVEDSVFCLTLEDKSRLCLRLFERTEAEGPLAIATCLASRGLPTCPPLPDKRGAILHVLNGKPACLFPWIEGSWCAEPSLAQIAMIGDFLGKMAKASMGPCSGWWRENPRGWQWFDDTVRRISAVVNDETAAMLQDEMTSQRSFWFDANLGDVARGAVHADLFRNNVMFTADGNIGAVIDWGFCASDWPFIYDLAIVANDWCLGKDSVSLDPEKLEALLTARESILPLTDAEKEAWRMALRLAALRFYLSRAVDRYLPEGRTGKTLDPQHFERILKARRRLPQ